MTWERMQRVETGAGFIEYDEVGEGPVVVLLHGLLMNHTLWDRVLPLLPAGFRYVRPVLPWGGHRVAMRPDADLSLRGMVQIIADVLEALDLDDVTLVHTDCGAGLFLTAHGLDHRVGRLVILPCEAFENFPPGIPGKMAALAARAPGGVAMAARQLRIGWLRRNPLLFGQMARRPIPDELMRGWTEHLLSDRAVRRDLTKYARERFDRASLVRDTEALASFTGDALVLWSPDNRVMPPEHGARLAELLPAGRLEEIPGALVLSMLDEPALVAQHMGAFLLESAVSPEA